jgi:hypothetical protein
MADVDAASLAGRLRRLADELVDVGQDMARIGEFGSVAEGGGDLVRMAGVVLAWADVIDGPKHERLAESDA